MSDNIQVGAIGLVITLTITEDDVAVNISSATTKTIKIRKPDGTVLAKTAAFTTNGSDGKVTNADTPPDTHVTSASLSARPISSRVDSALSRTVVRKSSVAGERSTGKMTYPGFEGYPWLAWVTAVDEPHHLAFEWTPGPDVPDDPETAPPAEQIFVRRRLGWMADAHSLPDDLARRPIEA